MGRILIVEDVDSLREVLATVLTCEGYSVVAAASAEEGIRIIEGSEPFMLVLTDLKLPNQTGLDFLIRSKQLHPEVPVVVMTAYGSIETAVEAMRHGAADFITKPFDPEMLVRLLAQVLEYRRVIERDAHVEVDRPFLTRNSAVETVLRQAKKVAPLSSPVMILGESGTGKELLARYIHQHSGRSTEDEIARHRFVAINCGSMPEELLESEFFGHESGAFTGATEQRIGLFEVAHNGTIFLDEVGNMPKRLQVKLLRTLQEREIRRVGGNRSISIDARVISATNSDVENEIKTGIFREDLYYRLGVVVLEIPPLRDRREDIELLARYFVKSVGAKFNHPDATITSEAIRLLERHDWPGNVRELENVLQRALIFSNGHITHKSFDAAFINVISAREQRSLVEVANAAAKIAEITAIRHTLLQTEGNKLKAAKLLGISYKTLLNKVKEYELEPGKSV